MTNNIFFSEQTYVPFLIFLNLYVAFRKASFSKVT